MRRALLALLAVAVAVPVAADTMRSEAAGLRFQVPGDWARVPAPSDMRAAQFRVPQADGDAEDGELVLFFFGKEQGGSADQNVERWTGQFTQPDGKPSKDAARGDDQHRERSQGDVASTSPARTSRRRWAARAARRSRAGGSSRRSSRGRVDRGSGASPGPDATVKAAKPQFEALLDVARSRTSDGVRPSASQARRRARRRWRRRSRSTRARARRRAARGRPPAPTQWAVNSGWWFTAGRRVDADHRVDRRHGVRDVAHVGRAREARSSTPTRLEEACGRAPRRWRGRAPRCSPSWTTSA